MPQEVPYGLIVERNLDAYRLAQADRRLRRELDELRARLKEFEVIFVAANEPYVNRCLALSAPN